MSKNVTHDMKSKNKKNYPSIELEELITLENSIPIGYEWSIPRLVSETKYVDDNGFWRTDEWVRDVRTGKINIDSELPFFENVIEALKSNLPVDIQNKITSSIQDKFLKLVRERELYFKVMEEIKGLRNLTQRLQIYNLYLKIWKFPDSYVTSLKEHYFPYLGDEWLMDLSVKERIHEFPVPLLTDPEASNTFTFDLCIDSSHSIQFRANDLTRLVTGVDARRLRLCPICLHVFWASRLDKRCCSIPCGNTLKMRDYRAKIKNKEEEKKQVRKNWNNLQYGKK